MARQPVDQLLKAEARFLLKCGWTRVEADLWAPPWDRMLRYRQGHAVNSQKYTIFQDRKWKAMKDNAEKKAANEKPRKPRGFAAMDPAKVSALASLGGKAAHAAGTAHRFTREEAKMAGKKGGLASGSRRIPAEKTGPVFAARAGTTAVAVVEGVGIAVDAETGLAGG